MRRSFAQPVAILTAVLFVGACSSSDDSADEPTTAAPVTTVVPPESATSAASTTTPTTTSATRSSPASRSTGKAAPMRAPRSSRLDLSPLTSSMQPKSLRRRHGA